MASLGNGVLGTVPAGFVASAHQPNFGTSLGIGVFRGLESGTEAPIPTEGQLWPRGDYRPH